MDDDFFENDDFFTDDEALDYILYEDMQKKGSGGINNTGCLGAIAFVLVPFLSITVLITEYC